MSDAADLTYEELREATRESIGDLASNLRMLRAHHQLTLEEASNRAGIDRHTLGKYERGEGNPRLRMLTRIAAAYNVGVGALVRPVNIPDLDPDDE